MRKCFVTVATSIVVLLCAICAAAQTQTQLRTEPQPQTPKQAETQASVDEQIRALENDIQDSQKRIEILKKIKALQDQLAEMDRAGSAPAAAPLPSSPPASPRPQPQPPIVVAGAATETQTVTFERSDVVLASPASAPPAPTTPQSSTSTQPANSCAAVLFEPSAYSRDEQLVCFLARSIVQRREVGVANNDPNLAMDGINRNQEDVAFFLPLMLSRIVRATPNIGIDAAVKSFVLDVEASRTDKQFGADSRSPGTTSLGVKGGVPSVLSWAVENGAAVASRSGTTLTFRANPVGFLEALSGQGYISGFREKEDDALVRFFRRTSIGFSFDTTRGTTSPTLTGTGQQLSAVSARYQFVNQRDPRARRYTALWNKFFETQGIAFTQAQTDQLMKMQLGNPDGTFKDPSLEQWVVATNTALKATKVVPNAVTENDAIDEVRRILESRLKQLPITDLVKDTDLVTSLGQFVGAYVPYLKAKKDIMDEVARGTLITFEYTNYREPVAPDLSNFRLIAEDATVGGFDITANASLTLFNKKPVGPDVSRIRDFDFSTQIDRKLGDMMGMGPSTISFTGKYQRLLSNVVAFDGTVLPNLKGDIAAGQIKLTIPLGATGLKLPISITFANRTELVRETEVRGNFGFSLDFDTLFARFKPF